MILHATSRESRKRRRFSERLSGTTSLRMTLDGWAEALERDVRRATSALASADEAGDEPPTDDQVAAIEECLWRLASATEKADAIVSLAFGGEPFVVVADKPSVRVMEFGTCRRRRGGSK